MIRTVLGFAAGIVVGGLVANSGSVKKFKEIASEKASALKDATCENTAKVKSATQKAAAAVREEFKEKDADPAEETA